MRPSLTRRSVAVIVPKSSLINSGFWPPWQPQPAVDRGRESAVQVPSRPGTGRRRPRIPDRGVQCQHGREAAVHGQQHVLQQVLGELPVAAQQVREAQQLQAAALREAADVFGRPLIVLGQRDHILCDAFGPAKCCTGLS
jgi:hypothetical protein